MFEGPITNPPEESEPNLLTREEIVGVLRGRGIEDPEVKQKLIEYQRTLEQLTYTVESGNDENIRLAIHMAQIYFEGNYKEYAIESLEELLGLNLSEDLEDEVYRVLNKMEN